MSIVDEVRKKLNMDDPKDVEAWDMLMDIQKIPQGELVAGMVADMRKELFELDEQIETMEKLRIRYLYSNNNLSQQAIDSLKVLRRERDELEQTLQSKAYQRVGGRPGSQPLETR